MDSRNGDEAQIPVRPGEVIKEKFEILRVIGIGGMGVVCEAMHLELRKRVAIKFVRPELAQDERFVTRFLNEARAAAALHSAHVAHVLEHGRPRVGFLGISGQGVRLPEGQRGNSTHDRGLLVVAVTAGAPAAAAGVLVGDILLALDGHAVGSTDDLLALLTADRVGRAVTIKLLRGGAVRDIAVTVGERPAS